MTKGVYVGAISHLVGKSASLRFPPEESHVLAQFDEMNLTRKQAHPAPERFDGPWPDDSLGLGWHVFRKEEFDVI